MIKYSPDQMLNYSLKQKENVANISRHSSNGSTLY